MGERVGGKQAAARRLPDLECIFNSGLFPKFLRGASLKAFPEGRLPCLSKPLRPGMFPQGWKKPRREFEIAATTTSASSRPTTTRSAFPVAGVRNGSDPAQASGNSTWACCRDTRCIRSLPQILVGANDPGLPVRPNVPQPPAGTAKSNCYAVLQRALVPEEEQPPGHHADRHLDLHPFDAPLDSSAAIKFALGVRRREISSSLSSWPGMTLSARHVLDFPSIKRIKGPPVSMPKIKHAEPVQVSTLLRRFKNFIDSLIHCASKMRDPLADAAVWATTLSDVRSKFPDQPVHRRFFDELLSPGNWAPPPIFRINTGYKWRPINDAMEAALRCLLPRMVLQSKQSCLLTLLEQWAIPARPGSAVSAQCASSAHSASPGLRKRCGLFSRSRRARCASALASPGSSLPNGEGLAWG